MAYSQEIKQFLSSNAWKEYLYPAIMQVVSAQLPDPSEIGWEMKYQKMFALSSAFQLIMNSLESAAGMKAFIEKTQRFSEGKDYDGTPAV